MAPKSAQKRASQPFSWAEFQSHIRYLPTMEFAKIQEAFELGAEVHGDQLRKSGEPYFLHPIAVASILAGMGADAMTIIAALLHDALEDTELSEDEIEERFGKTVLAMIDALTKLDAEDFTDKPSMDDQIETLRKLFNYMQKDVRIMVIKLADRLHNMQTLEFLPEERQKSMAQETHDVYAKIADRLSMEEMRDELEELALKILDPELFTKLCALRTKSEKVAEQAIEKMKSRIREFGPAFPFDMRYEHKDWPRLRTLYETGENKVTGVSSRTVVFLCDSIEMCYRTLGVIHQIWQRESLSFQDFINAPKINGYRGLHTTIIGARHGTRILCKIRTRKMHEYARKGITTLCFDSEAAGVMDYLPWTRRISPLSEDTANRSENFWRSLQSDLLGESILVHGVDDRQLQLPQGSTVLDGAFYFYGDRALNLLSVKANGREVSFHTLLEHAVSLECTLGSRATVLREWLEWVHTGFAAAKVREGLAAQSMHTKIDMGKSLLQEIMVENRKGLLVEFDENAMQLKMQSLGLQSLDEGYIAIAEGRMDQHTIYDALFSLQKQSRRDNSAVNRDTRHKYAVSFHLKKDDIEALGRLVQIYARYRSWIGRIRIIPVPFSAYRHFSVTANLTAEELEVYKKDVGFATGEQVKVTSRYTMLKYFTGVFVLLFLWGVDPVVAHLLIADLSVAPIDLALIRFWSLAFLCSVLIMVKVLRGEMKKEIILSMRSVWLWGSAAALVLTALATYAALQFTLPSHYTILMTAAGMIVSGMQYARHWSINISMWVLFALGAAALIVGNPQWSVSGVMLTVLAVACFTLFSFISQKHKQQEHVAGRVLQYFFILSLLCTLLSLPLIALSTIGIMPVSLIFGCVLFTLFIAGLPYYLFYYALSRKQIEFVLRYSFLIIIVSVGGQVLLFGEMSRTIALAAVLVMIGALLPLIANNMMNKTPSE